MRRSYYKPYKQNPIPLSGEGKNLMERLRDRMADAGCYAHGADSAQSLLITQIRADIVRYISKLEAQLGINEYHRPPFKNKFQETTMIDFTKPLARRQLPTRQVRILATDLPGRTPVAAADDDGEISRHRLDGRHPGSPLMDLVPLQVEETATESAKFIRGQRLMCAGEIVTIIRHDGVTGDPVIRTCSGDEVRVRLESVKALPNGQL